MPKSNFGRFTDGVQISGVTLNIHQKGKVFYVCNSSTSAPIGSAGADSNSGLTPERPLATITQALSLCTASRGDKIILLPGHAESVASAAALDFNVAGVEVIGVGTGSVRPTITLTTANTATVRISANDVKIQNILFKGNFLAIATCIILTTATDVQILDCDFRDVDATHGFVKAIKTHTVDNSNDGLVVRNCNMLGTGTTAATCLVNVLQAIDRMQVRDNNVFIQGTTATTGVLVLATSKVMTTVFIDSNNAQSLYTGSAGALIVGTTGSTGMVSNNNIGIVTGGTALLATASTGLVFMNNYITNTADKSGILNPANT